MKCHQRKLRDKLMDEQPKPIQATLDGCIVCQITKDQAASVILVYEWLGTMPNAGIAFYGLFDNEVLIGVVCFGKGSGSKANTLCGDKNKHLAICLERGACVHWAHPHAASYLISRACKQAANDYGWKIFYAYSDREAGEIGTVYQACNWIYLGQGAGRPGNSWRFFYTSPDGKGYNSRSYRAYKKRKGLEWKDMELLGWLRRRQYDRGKYVLFVGSKTEKKLLRRALRYEEQSYPKRQHK